ncbi:MAG: NADH:ubiquinone reductase (Na(+)-transporting) subunit C [Marinifilaceae bacterium]
MNRQSNGYTFIYSIVLVVVVAIVLSLIAMGLQPRQNENIRNEKRQNILSSVNIKSTAAESEALYNKYITESFVVNSKGERVDGNAFTVDIAQQSKLACDKKQLPVFIATIDGQSKYILPVYGVGLWGPIWGYVALDADKSTVYGAVFDHKSETPGLGAEITSQHFTKQFNGKLIFDGSQLTGIAILKGGGATGTHEVDAISGGTITSKGVEKMIQVYLSCYEPFLKQK